MPFSIHTNSDLRKVLSALYKHSTFVLDKIGEQLEVILQPNSATQLWKQSLLKETTENYRSHDAMSGRPPNNLPNPYSLTFVGIPELANLKILFAYKYNCDLGLDKKPEQQFYLVIPVEIDPVSACSLQIGLQIKYEYDASSKCVTDITLCMQQFYKIKLFSIDKDEGIAPDLYVLQMLNPNFNLASYSRPAGEMEICGEALVGKKTCFTATDNCHYIITPFIEGETLEQFEHRRLSLMQILFQWIQIAHELTLVHLLLHIFFDLKPGNILFSGPYCDFIDIEQPRKIHTQPLRQIDGASPGFMAPYVGSASAPAISSPTTQRRKLLKDTAKKAVKNLFSDAPSANEPKAPVEMKRSSSETKKIPILDNNGVIAPMRTERMKTIIKETQERSISTYAMGEIDAPEIHADLHALGITFLMSLLGVKHIRALQVQSNWPFGNGSAKTVEDKEEAKYIFIANLVKDPKVEYKYRQESSTALWQQLFEFSLKLLESDHHKLNSLKVYKHLYSLFLENSNPGEIDINKWLDYRAVQSTRYNDITLNRNWEEIPLSA